MVVRTLIFKPEVEKDSRLPPTDNVNAQTPMRTLVFNAPMSNPARAAHVESFNPAIPRGMTRIGTNKIDLRPQVLDVRNDIRHIQLVKLELPGLGIACNLLHVLRVVRLQDRRRTKNREDVDQRTSNGDSSLIDQCL